MINGTLSKNKHFMGEAILFITFVLSLIGMAITDFSPLESHRYWDFMIVFLAIASIGLGWSQELYKETIFQLIVRQLIHWGATLITVSGVYLLLYTGRLNYESTGLIVELILGLSLFLDGRNLGWRISLLGILVGITAIIAAYVEEYIWVILFVSACLWVVTYYLEKLHHKSRL